MKTTARFKSILTKGAIVLMLMACLTMLGCGSSSSSTSSSTDTSDSSLSISDIALNATLSLSDASTITAETVRISRVTSGVSLTTGANSVVDDALSKTSLFSSEADYSIAISLEQNDKTYIWSTSNITVTTDEHVNLGNITLNETGLLKGKLNYNTSLDSLGYNYTVVDDSTTEFVGTAFMNLLDTTFALAEDSTSSALKADFTMALPEGTFTLTLEPYGVTDSQTVNFVDVVLSSKVINGGVTTDVGEQVLVAE
jgi:hypothetical protein